MAGEEIGAKLVKVSTSRVSKCKLRIRKHRRNRNRNLRRRKSKSEYLHQNICNNSSSNNNLTSKKHSHALCNSLTVFDITDDNMNGEREESLRRPPAEVAQWQYQHQLAYWRSRAISLEYENRMLHAHIKKMCSKDVQDYVDYVKDGQNSNAIVGKEEENNVSDEAGTKELFEEVSYSKIYGEKESKIRGMETAMKVNYDMQVERCKAQMWPNIPLNL